MELTLKSIRAANIPMASARKFFTTNNLDWDALVRGAVINVPMELLQQIPEPFRKALFNKGN